ncbi:PAZ domain-containing protein [Mycena olivaceomarginata]|nr:PAZ domain-containing protein [Mycena olivaceomarginata]
MFDEPAHFRISCFTPRCVYDGCKNIFSIHRLKFDIGSQKFDGTLRQRTLCVLKKLRLSTVPANKLMFTMREGQSMTVADYFQRTQNKPLQFPNVICSEVGSGAFMIIPLELCDMPPGQLMRKQVPPEKTKDLLDFCFIHLFRVIISPTSQRKAP